MDDDLVVVLDEITKAYSVGDRTPETDNEDLIILKFQYSEAMQALQKLRLYEG